MTSGFVPSSAADSASQPGRALEPAEWAEAGIPLLRTPRAVVTGLYDRHLPRASTAVVAVFGPDERLVASASFHQPPDSPDGWTMRNALLSQLRLVLPHDLRRRTPVRTAVLLYCREGKGRWTEVDGAWMWGLRDACTLHGLRCGAYVLLTREGWQVLGEGRSGRTPRLTDDRTTRSRTMSRPPAPSPSEIPPAAAPPQAPVTSPAQATALVQATGPAKVTVPEQATGESQEVSEAQLASQGTADSSATRRP